MKQKQGLPLSILLEAYRPLAIIASEILLAASPFLPEFAQTWAQRLARLEESSL